MSSKTKILVVKLKEVILTSILVILGIVIILTLILIITGKKKKPDPPLVGTYSPGVYNSSIVLSKNPMEIEVVVDSDQIKSINIINTSETIETMYPLISTSLAQLAEQIIQNGSIENITYPDESRYTSMVLLSAIESALQKATLH